MDLTNNDELTGNVHEAFEDLNRIQEITEPVDTAQEQSSSQNMDLANNDTLTAPVDTAQGQTSSQNMDSSDNNALTEPVDTAQEQSSSQNMDSAENDALAGNFDEAFEDLNRIQEITGPVDTTQNQATLIPKMEFDDDTLRETAQVYKELGDAYLAEREFKNALSFYTQGIDVKCKDDQLSVELYLARSRLQASLENFQEALGDLERVEEITEMNPSALHGTGLDHDSLRGVHEAFEDLNRKQEITEPVDKAQGQTSSQNMDSSDNDVLTEPVDKVQEQSSSQNMDLADNEALSGNVHEAFEDLNRIKEITGPVDTAHNQAILIPEMEFDDDNLRETAEVYKELGDAEFAKKEFRNAVSFYTQGIDVKCKDDQLNVKLYLSRSWSQGSLGNFQEALEDLHRIEEITEMNPSALHGSSFDQDSWRAFLKYVKGELEHNRKDYRKALSFYTEGIELKCKDDQTNVILYSRRSHSHSHLGNIEDAFEDRKHWKEIIAMNPSISEECCSTCDAVKAADKWLKGGIELKHNVFRNALSCYIKGIDIKCKDDGLNINLYSKRTDLNSFPDNSRAGLIGKNRAEEIRQDVFIEPFENNEQQLMQDMTLSASGQLHVDFDDDALRETAQKNEEKGDAEYKTNEFSNAAFFYTEGIEMRCKDVALNAVLYKKRAACHFFLGNSPEARRDLMIATKILLAHVIATEKGEAECKENESGNPLSFFTEGVDVTCKDDDLNAIFYTRRAATHFSMGNFHDAVKDAKRARAFHYCYGGVRTFQKSPLQAIVTGAKACKELQLYEEAIKWCCDGLAIDPEIKTLQEVKGKSIEHKAKYNDAQKLNSKTETDAVKGTHDEKGSLSRKIIDECRGLSYKGQHDFNRALNHLLISRMGLKMGLGCMAKDGLVLLASGKKEKAIQCFNQSLAAFRDLEDREGEESVGVFLATVYQSLSWEYHLAQDYHRAEEYFKRRVVIMKETGLAIAQQEKIGEPHFNLYQVCKNFEKAKEYYSEDLAVCKKMRDRPGEGLANRNLGDTCYLTGLDEVLSSRYMRDAMMYYEKYLNISVELGDKGKEGDAYFSIGRIHQYLLDREKTKHYYSKCLTICKEIGDREGEKHALRKLRSTLFVRGDLKQVMQLNNQLHFISKKSHDHFHEAEALIYQGHCLAECRFFSDAVLSYQSAVKKANSIRDWNILEDWMKISIRQFFRIAYAALSASLLKLDKADEALLAAENGRAQALADLLETQYGFEARHHGQDSVENSQQETASELLTCVPANTIFLAVFQNVISVWLLQNGKQVHFSQSNLSEHHSNDQSSFLAETYKEVGVNRKVRCEDRSLDVLRNKGGLTVQRPTDLPLLSFDAFLRNGDKKTSRTLPPVHRKHLSVLYDAIVAPVIPHLHGNELVIVPDGEFFLVPFGAIRDTESRYLCESFSIRVIPSLTCLKMIMDAPTNHHCKRGALVVGDPWVQEVQNYEGRKPSQLPGARREAEMIAAIVKTSPLIGSDATKEAVLSRLSNVALIHLAAHGESKTGEILLAPNLSRESMIPSRKDYLLTMPDVLSVGLRARLVVLSCCHSGQGEVYDEGVVGIARAFLGAGARSVLVSLWAIDDEATLEFMRVFYQHLTRGKKASQALSGATNYMRESSHMREATDYGATCHWAPFVLIGDDVTLDCFEEDCNPGGTIQENVCIK